jgi:hypothetical protein
MLRQIPRAAIVVLLAAGQAACSATVVVGTADPYAGCVDLGDLALTSSSRSDAQDRMEARVRELGGDTLLFGERGRSRRLGQMPEEIAKRRDELRPPNPKSDEALLAGASTIDAQTLPGELWYYGAALRCKERKAAKE